MLVWLSHQNLWDLPSGGERFWTQIRVLKNYEAVVRMAKMIKMDLFIGLG